MLYRNTGGNYRSHSTLEGIYRSQHWSWSYRSQHWRELQIATLEGSYRLQHWRELQIATLEGITDHNTGGSYRSQHWRELQIATLEGVIDRNTGGNYRSQHWRELQIATLEGITDRNTGGNYRSQHWRELQIATLEGITDCNTSPFTQSLGLSAKSTLPCWQCLPPRWWFSFISIGLIPSHHYVPVVTDELLRQRNTCLTQATNIIMVPTRIRFLMTLLLSA